MQNVFHVAFLYKFYYILNALHTILPGRLVVGHRPLEANTGVRIPARQPLRKSHRVYEVRIFKRPEESRLGGTTRDYK